MIKKNYMIQPTNLDIDEAKRQVLAYYYMDLMYIHTFQKFKDNQLNLNEYLKGTSKNSRYKIIQ